MHSKSSVFRGRTIASLLALTNDGLGMGGSGSKTDAKKKAVIRLYLRNTKHSIHKPVSLGTPCKMEFSNGLRKSYPHAYTAHKLL